MPEILEGNYKVGRVLSVNNGLAWIRWVGYNFLGDTCEPIEHIEPRSKLTSFLKGKQVSVDLSGPRAFLSKHLISMATSNKISRARPNLPQGVDHRAAGHRRDRHGHPQPRQAAERQA